MPDYFAAFEGTVTKDKFQRVGFQCSWKNSYIQIGKDFTFTSVKWNLLSYSSGCIQGPAEEAHPRCWALGFTAETSQGHCPGCGSGSPVFHFTSTPMCHLWGFKSSSLRSWAAPVEDCDGDTHPASARDCQEVIYDTEILRGAEALPLHRAAMLRDTRQETQKHRAGRTCLSHLAQSIAIPGMFKHAGTECRKPWPCVGACGRKETTRPWLPNLAAGMPGCPSASGCLPCTATARYKELHGTGKLHTNWLQCPRDTYCISNAIVQVHKLNRSSTDISWHHSKQRGLCRQIQWASFLGFWIYNDRRSTSADFLFETGTFPLHSLLHMLVTILLLKSPSSGLR